MTAGRIPYFVMPVSMELEPSKVPGMGSGLSGGSPVKYKPPNPLPEKNKFIEFHMIN